MRFTDHGDGTVTDTTTGLMWMKEPISERMTWNEATTPMGTLNSASHLGHSDWRLPEVKELISLVDYSKYGPALPEGHPFVNVQSSYYWSSSSSAGGTDYAWVVYMWYGYVYSYGKTNYNSYVWPVRSGQREEV